MNNFGSYFTVRQFVFSVRNFCLAQKDFTFRRMEIFLGQIRFLSKKGGIPFGVMAIQKGVFAVLCLQ
ncbi:hypothetical protein HMPREF1981_02718 [Bacteroides pyogenes F0041]|uniref:Uncharacterized protein n=1 Tax=Bacteroides pyogenes F0041 TaxID=1321819 RepID=U2CDD2_9BACE|nr:hypothetical protein HMPREF1981_02718 [Bacteroides pyogenes F0041]